MDTAPDALLAAAAAGAVPVAVPADLAVTTARAALAGAATLPALALLAGLTTADTPPRHTALARPTFGVAAASTRGKTGALAVPLPRPAAAAALQTDGPGTTLTVPATGGLADALSVARLMGAEAAASPPEAPGRATTAGRAAPAPFAALAEAQAALAGAGPGAGLAGQAATEEGQEARSEASQAHAAADRVTEAASMLIKRFGIHTASFLPPAVHGDHPPAVPGVGPAWREAGIT